MQNRCCQGLVYVGGGEISDRLSDVLSLFSLPPEPDELGLRVVFLPASESISVLDGAGASDLRTLLFVPPEPVGDGPPGDTIL